MGLTDPNRVLTPLCAVRLSAARRMHLPPWIDAVVEEQDRWLVLGQGPERAGRDPQGYLQELGLTSVDELLAAASRSEPPPLGTVLLRKTRPPRLLAVVHDLERTATLGDAAVAQALETILKLTVRASMRAVALPVIGYRNDARAVEAFAEGLGAALSAAGPARLRIAMMATPAVVRGVARVLGETCPNVGVALDC